MVMTHRETACTRKQKWGAPIRERDRDARFIITIHLSPDFIRVIVGILWHKKGVHGDGGKEGWGKSGIGVRGRSCKPSWKACQIVSCWEVVREQ